MVTASPRAALPPPPCGWRASSCGSRGSSAQQTRPSWLPGSPSWCHSEAAGMAAAGPPTQFLQLPGTPGRPHPLEAHGASMSLPEPWSPTVSVCAHGREQQGWTQKRQLPKRPESQPQASIGSEERARHLHQHLAVPSFHPHGALVAAGGCEIAPASRVDTAGLPPGPQPLTSLGSISALGGIWFRRHESLGLSGIPCFPQC